VRLCNGRFVKRSEVKSGYPKEKSDPIPSAICYLYSIGSSFTSGDQKNVKYDPL